MKYFTIGYKLPFFKKPLYGDREKHGLIAKKNDPSWKEWINQYINFYESTQKESVGDTVNKSGYPVMEEIDLSDKVVLEIGPGQLQHIKHWKGVPKNYILADIKKDFLDQSEKILKKNKISSTSLLIDEEEPHKIPLEDNSIDVIVTFYSLEHLYPLQNFIDEYIRVLKQGGKIIGAIPAEGGLAWGMGRFLTSRRWIKKNTSIDFDKIICWEHPNFADHILKSLDENFSKNKQTYWPIKIPLIDINLVIKFIYEKTK